MAPTDETRGTIRPTTLASDKHSMVRIEASPGAADRAPQYVDSVLQELRQIVVRARCPVHGCGPVLTVDFGSGAQESLLVIPQLLLDPRQIGRARASSLSAVSLTDVPQHLAVARGFQS